MSKKTYYIEMPVTAVLRIHGVEAESEEEAIEKVLDSDIYIDAGVVTEGIFDDIHYEWSMHEQIVRGNVFYGVQNEMSIEEEDF